LDGSTVIYAPYYMPLTHAKYRRDKQAFIDETVQYMKLIRSDFLDSDVLAATASRYDYAQTVCTPGFLALMPSMQSKIQGLFFADTSHYYPEDRSISESLQLGGKLAELTENAMRDGTSVHRSGK
nr:hypothetical protein [Actinomycetota bacterium]